MTPPTPDTLAAYRRRYPGYVVVFRGDGERCWVSAGSASMYYLTGDGTQNAILYAAMRGVGVLVVEDVKEEVKR